MTELLQGDVQLKGSFGRLTHADTDVQHLEARKTVKLILILLKNEFVFLIKVLL